MLDAPLPDAASIDPATPVGPAPPATPFVPPAPPAHFPHSDQQLAQAASAQQPPAWQAPEPGRPYDAPVWKPAYPAFRITRWTRRDVDESITDAMLRRRSLSPPPPYRPRGDEEPAAAAGPATRRRRSLVGQVAGQVGATTTRPDHPPFVPHPGRQALTAIPRPEVREPPPPATLPSDRPPTCDEFVCPVPPLLTQHADQGLDHPEGLPRRCGREAPAVCEDMRHPRQAPHRVCGECDSAGRAMVLDPRLHAPAPQPQPHGYPPVVLGASDILGLRARVCAGCVDAGMADARAFVGLGYDVYGVDAPPGLTASDAALAYPADYARDAALRDRAAGGYRGGARLRPLTGCACGARLLGAVLCRRHRAEHARELLARAAELRRYVERNFCNGRDTHVGGGVHNLPCPVCLDDAGVPAAAGSSLRLPPLPTTAPWLCLACHSFVVAPRALTEAGVLPGKGNVVLMEPMPPPLEQDQP